MLIENVPCIFWSQKLADACLYEIGSTTLATYNDTDSKLLNNVQGEKYALMIGHTPESYNAIVSRHAEIFDRCVEEKYNVPGVR